MIPPKSPGKLTTRRDNYITRFVKGLLKFVAHFHIPVTEDTIRTRPSPWEKYRVDIHGSLRRQDRVRLIRGQEIGDSVSVGDLHGHHRMRHDETIVADHDRYINGLGNPVRLNDGINNLLVVRAVNLYPARISLRYGILLVVKYRPRRSHSPVDAAHHDRQPRTGSPMYLLVHVKQSLGTGRCEDACPHGGCRYANCKGRMFRFNTNIFCLELSALYRLGKHLRYRGLRCNRIRCHDLNMAELCPESRS